MQPVRSAAYAVGNGIPVVGGSIGESMSAVFASAEAVAKNIGVFGAVAVVLLLFFTAGHRRRAVAFCLRFRVLLRKCSGLTVCAVFSLSFATRILSRCRACRRRRRACHYQSWVGDVMNEFFFTSLFSVWFALFSNVCCRKRRAISGALCSLFVVVCVLGAFTLSDGIEFPPSAPVAYDDMSDYAFRKACEEHVSEICEEYGVTASSVQIVLQNGKKRGKTDAGHRKKRRVFAARLREIFRVRGDV